MPKDKELGIRKNWRLSEQLYSRLEKAVKQIKKDHKNLNISESDVVRLLLDEALKARGF